MKKITYFLFTLLFIVQISCSQSTDSTPITPPTEKPIDPGVPPVSPPDQSDNTNYQPIEKDQIAYYKDIDFTTRGKKLHNQLHDLLRNTQTTLSYTPDIWEANKITDQDPDNADNVLVLYGWDVTESKELKLLRSMPKHATNNKGDKEPNRNTKWEREHVYAKSLGKPKLQTQFKVSAGENLGIDVIAGNDVHNLRPANGIMNSDRGNKKFGDAKGNSHSLGGGYWYPGDEWVGDVARMMMYMYVRYNEQCLPSNIASLPYVIDPITGDRDMVQLLLKWNAQDPVSQIEIQRNNYHGNPNNTYSQGNRNPFIDNPHLANLIWGEQQQENLNAKSLWQELAK